MFCVATTPAPARAKAQRAATAGDEEDIAIPIMPDCGQRADIEKVTWPLPSMNGYSSSGITAIASISTSHSGRARAETTIPVDTGKTPFSHLPTTR